MGRAWGVHGASMGAHGARIWGAHLGRAWGARQISGADPPHRPDLEVEGSGFTPRSARPRVLVAEGRAACNAIPPGKPLALPNASGLPTASAGARRARAGRQPSRLPSIAEEWSRHTRPAAILAPSPDQRGPGMRTPGTRAC
jgi:hypothetical protein